MTGTLVALLVAASVAGLFVHGLYRDTSDWIAQTRATDLVTLAVAVPTLVASMLLTARGFQGARVVWAGILGYILYMYTIYAFDVAFNPLFLVYVAALSLAFWSLVALLSLLDPESFHVRGGSGRTVRGIAVFLLVVAALFFMAWMKDIIPAMLGDTTPASLAKTRQPTNPVEVLDLSILLPLCVLTAIWLWRRRPWGYALAGLVLTTMTIVSVSVVVDMVFEHANDPTISFGMAPVFVGVTLAGLGLLVAYLRNLRQVRDRQVLEDRGPAHQASPDRTARMA
jgi:hypothetical protein